MENRNTYFSRLWKTGIQVPTKCSGKELSQSGVCDDVFLSGYYVNGKRFTFSTTKTTLSWFDVHVVNEESDLVKVSLYRLLYKHSKTQQLRATLQNQLNQENSQYLKVVVAEFNKYHNTENIDLDDFLNSIGL